MVGGRGHCSLGTVHAPTVMDLASKPPGCDRSWLQLIRCRVRAVAGVAGGRSSSRRPVETSPRVEERISGRSETLDSRPAPEIGSDLKSRSTPSARHRHRSPGRGASLFGVLEPVGDRRSVTWRGPPVTRYSELPPSVASNRLKEGWTSSHPTPRCRAKPIGRRQRVATNGDHSDPGRKPPPGVGW